MRAVADKYGLILNPNGGRVMFLKGQVIGVWKRELEVLGLWGSFAANLETENKLRLSLPFSRLISFFFGGID